MVAGSTKKMYRQKGTGNARAGSKRSGIRRGGGHIFAKKNRDYGYRLPRRALQTATRMALAAKVRDDELVIIDDLSLAEPKTKEMVSVIKHVGCDGGSLLLATAAFDPMVYRSARNLPGVAVSPAGEINAYSVLRSRRVLVTKAALDALVASAKAKGAGGEANGNAAARPTRTKRVTTKSSTPRRATRKKAAE
jgi:large subunit ribosomal protein L4